jgi:hypothetical protein
VGVDDSAVLDAQLFEAVLPVLELGPVSAREGDVIQTGPARVETAGQSPSGNACSPKSVPPPMA